MTAPFLRLNPVRQIGPQDVESSAGALKVGLLLDNGGIPHARHRSQMSIGALTGSISWAIFAISFDFRMKVPKLE